MQIGKWTERLRRQWNEGKGSKSLFSPDVCADYDRLPDDELFKSFHISVEHKEPVAIFTLREPERRVIPVSGVFAGGMDDVFGGGSMNPRAQIMEIDTKIFSLADLNHRHEALSAAGLDSGLTEQAIRELEIEMNRSDRLHRRNAAQRAEQSHSQHGGRD